MIVVSDTTPVISLIKAGHLELLRLMFQEVLVPEAVYHELTTNIVFEQEAAEVRNCPFIKIMPVVNLQSVTIFRKVTGLDAGESEAIVLADEQQANLLLMDEHKGRRVAKQMGLTITGTIGILLQAYDEELLSKPEVELCLQKMKECGIRMSQALYELVLNHIGE